MQGQVIVSGAGGRLGDDEARVIFERLYADSYRKLLAYSLQRTPNREDAVDVVAETFLVAWRRLEEAVAAEYPLAWLYGVAYRVIGNHRRGAVRRNRLASKLQSGSANPVSRDPADLVETHFHMTQVESALMVLSERERELLRLTAYQELSPSEIAAVLQLPPAVVRNLLYRARIRLRRELETSSSPTGESPWTEPDTPTSNWTLLRSRRHRSEGHKKADG